MISEVTGPISLSQANKPRLVPLAWQDGKLVPTIELGLGAGEQTGQLEVRPEVTVLHTNDFHSSINGRPDPVTSKLLGGIARIATTVRQAQEAGPTLVLDAGDSVFGSGTWWDAHGATTTGQLRGAAGYDLAAIGNHDLEHGLAGLAELLEGGYSLVGSNLVFEEARFQEKVRPAYLVELAGWRIGIMGVTTPDTLHLVPSRMLKGMALTDPAQAINDILPALEPLVDTIILISHLGFEGHGMGDRDLAPRLVGSKVSVILGGHTHEAQDPAPTIGGIVVCNAGAYGANVNQIRLKQVAPDMVEVRTRLLAQDEAVAEEPGVAALRDRLAQAFQPLFETRFSLPSLPGLGEDGLQVSFKKFSFNRDNEFILLARALREIGPVDPSGLSLIPFLYVLGQLPKPGNGVTLAELRVGYPNIEQLVELELQGHALKELLNLQSSLMFYQQALPLWLASESRVKPAQLDDNAVYRAVTTELVAEGGLGWQPLPGYIKSVRPLELTCAEVVQLYLQTITLSSVA